MVDLRVYLQIEDLQTQFAAYMATALRARGYVPLQGMHSLIIEIAPALAIHRVTDLALKSVPTIEPGILYVERQFGILELHSPQLDDLHAAGEAILSGFKLEAASQLKPRVLYSDLVTNVIDQHAVIINRQRDASMILPDESMLLLETAPALFAAAAANAAERAVAENVLIDCQMFGVSGQGIHRRNGRKHPKSSRSCARHDREHTGARLVDRRSTPFNQIKDSCLFQ